MEPPVANLVVPKRKISYSQSIEVSKSAYKYKIENLYKESNVVGIRQLNYLNPKYKEIHGAEQLFQKDE